MPLQSLDIWRYVGRMLFHNLRLFYNLLDGQALATVIHTGHL